MFIKNELFKHVFTPDTASEAWQSIVPSPSPHQKRRSSQHDFGLPRCARRDGHSVALTSY